MDSISYSDVLERFQQLGRFSANFPDLCTDDTLSAIEQNIYNEILDGVRHNAFSKNGNMVKCQYECAYDLVVINTLHKFNSSHVQSFHINKAQFDTLKAHFKVFSTIYPIIVLEDQHLICNSPVFFVCAPWGTLID